MTDFVSSKLENLGIIDVHSSDIRGFLPRSFTQLKNLFFLDLHDNKYIQGSIPDSYISLIGKRVDLSQIPFICPIPDWSRQHFGADCVNVE